MKLKNAANILALGALLAGGAACSESVDDPFFAAPLLGLSDQPIVVSSVPTAGAVGVSPTETVSIRFNKFMSKEKCPPAFNVQPTTASSTAGSVPGYGYVFNDFYVFTPRSEFGTGSFTMSMSTDCEDTDGRDLREQFDAEFLVGVTSIGPQGDLAVQAVGVASQSGCSGYPGTGSNVGGDHTIGTCWWDDSLPILSPAFYTLRPGDTGAGSCTDANTDNIVVIFSRYMDPNSTVAAVSLSRISPPVTTIRLSSWSWNDCQAVSPFGCRALTLVFAEDLASCGGTTAFGTSDYDLAQDSSGSGFPFYTLEVDTTATDIYGDTLPSTFSFSLEAE